MAGQDRCAFLRGEVRKPGLIRHRIEYHGTIVALFTRRIVFFFLCIFVVDFLPIMRVIHRMFRRKYKYFSSIGSGDLNVIIISANLKYKFQYNVYLENISQTERTSALIVLR